MTPDVPPIRPDQAPVFDPPRTTRARLPAIEKLLHALHPWEGLPRPLAVRECRRVVEELRGRADGDVPPTPVVETMLRERFLALKRRRLQPVINGTGVLLHTNLGRAPLSAAAVEAVSQVAAQYSNLEFDLAHGARGGRGAYLEECLTLLTGAEAATVVNNCAAALVLALAHTTRERREVVISRGELVQIGGGFRIPEILEASGACLREVGTTNRTDLRDYERAIGPRTGLILKVHRSNFFMDGFVASPRTEALAALARERGVPLIEDLGSGASTRLPDVPGMQEEPTPAEVVARGVDLVTFSGDKLLGGPQAGILVGTKTLVTALKAEPLFRALRCDKLVFAALQATVESHLHARAAEDVPVLHLAQLPVATLRARAVALATRVGSLPLHIDVVSTEARVGGGTLPRARIPSSALAIKPLHGALAAFVQRLATASPPVVGYVANDRLRLDLRTIYPEQDDQLVQALLSASSNG